MYWSDIGRNTGFPAIWCARRRHVGLAPGFGAPLGRTLLLNWAVPFESIPRAFRSSGCIRSTAFKYMLVLFSSVLALNFVFTGPSGLESWVFGIASALGFQT